MQGEDKLDIELIIKNNGSKQWPDYKAKLVFNENKNLVLKSILLEPQKPGEQQNYIIKLDGLGAYPPGKVDAEMNFEIDGEKYGDEIELNITINEKKKIIGEDDYSKQVQQFREEYGLSKDEYSDAGLLNKLKQHNFNFPMAFSSIFD